MCTKAVYLSKYCGDIIHVKWSKSWFVDMIEMHGIMFPGRCDETSWNRQRFKVMCDQIAARLLFHVCISAKMWCLIWRRSFALTTFTGVKSPSHSSHIASPFWTSIPAGRLLKQILKTNKRPDLIYRHQIFLRKQPHKRVLFFFDCGEATIEHQQIIRKQQTHQKILNRISSNSAVGLFNVCQSGVCVRVCVCASSFYWIIFNFISLLQFFFFL